MNEWKISFELAATGSPLSNRARVGSAPVESVRNMRIPACCGTQRLLGFEVTLDRVCSMAPWLPLREKTSSLVPLRLMLDQRGYAQHDARYLRAVPRTSKKLGDINVENHNLPMILLLREALRIKGGDKKKAVGLLDEAIRIPYGWVKSIPRESLPSSLALDNFLLPGNKEDGADKSRHWNVFGGICLYKSPQEALDLALKREAQDLRDDDYSEEGVQEFLRDMITNLNGMYHVMTVNPNLLSEEAPQKSYEVK